MRPKPIRQQNNPPVANKNENQTVIHFGLDGMAGAYKLNFRLRAQQRPRPFVNLYSVVQSVFFCLAVSLTIENSGKTIQHHTELQ